jgi:hypothetical protein
MRGRIWARRSCTGRVRSLLNFRYWVADQSFLMVDWEDIVGGGQWKGRDWEEKMFDVGVDV